MPTMRDINLGTCATLVGQSLLAPPSPQAMLRFAYATQQVQGIYVFQHLLGGRGALGSGERGTWERTDSFLKSSKDLLHYSMLFLEMSQVFLTSIVGYCSHSLLEHDSWQAIIPWHSPVKESSLFPLKCEVEIKISILHPCHFFMAPLPPSPNKAISTASIHYSKL